MLLVKNDAFEFSSVEACAAAAAAVDDPEGGIDFPDGFGETWGDVLPFPIIGGGN